MSRSKRTARARRTKLGLLRTDSTRDAAVSYARQGFRVVPLHGVSFDEERQTPCTCGKPNCGSPGKHPLLRDWPAEASSDVKTVESFFDRYPLANVGIAMGGARRLVAIDIDGPIGQESLEQVEREHGRLPTTLESQTGRDDGGRHRIYRLPKDLDMNALRNRVKILPGIDVRAEGGQIVVAPSMHASGRPYKWVNDIYPVLLPVWLFDVLQQKVDPRKEGGTLSPDKLETRESAARAHLAGLPAAVSGEGGHDRTFLAAMVLVRGFSLPAEDGLRLLRDEYNPRCSPPWSEEELSQKIQSALKDGNMEIGCFLDERPTIIDGPNEEEILDQVISALALDERIFQRRGGLVQFVRGESIGNSPKDDKPRIVALAHATLRELIARNAKCVRLGKDGKKRVPINPPAWWVQGVFGRASYPGIRRLEAIVSFPVLRPDGTILSRKGYDANSFLFYEPDAQYPSIAQSPTPKEGRRAIRKVLAVFQDFPFRTEAHRVAAVAALFTLVGRYAVDGPTPLFAIDGTTPGVGKSLLVDIISTIATGIKFPRMTHAQSDEEQKKMITSVALKGMRLAVVDNIARPFGSASLDAALTATSWSERLLSTNNMPELPLHTVWMATGNNLAFAGDTARRTIHIRLESPLESPEEKDDFVHGDLLGFVQKHRPALVCAVLTALRAYFAAGSPTIKMKTWGSYEAWSSVVRAALVWLGFPDPADTRVELMKESDTVKAMLRNLLKGLRAADPEGDGLSTREIVELTNSGGKGHERLRTAVEELMGTAPGKDFSLKSFGMKLSHLRNRVAGGLRLERRETKYGNVWFVIRQQPEGGT